MKHIKYIIAALSFLAFLPVATAQRTREGNPIHVNKTVTGNYTDGYTLTMESYVQGNAHTETRKVAADVALIMDISTSMWYAAKWGDWEYDLPVDVTWETTTTLTYNHILESVRYITDDGIFHEIFKGEEVEDGITYYTLWIYIDGEKWYLREDGSIKKDYSRDITTTNRQIYRGPLAKGLSYSQAKDGVTLEAIPGQSEQTQNNYETYIQYNGTPLRVYREHVSSTYALYVMLNGNKKYLNVDTLTDTPYRVTSQTSSIFFLPSVVTQNKQAGINRLQGLREAVSAFTDALRSKSIADPNNPLDFRMSMISFNLKRWGYEGAGSEETADLNYPDLKEYPQNYYPNTYGNSFTYLVKDFKDVSDQQNYNELKEAINTFAAKSQSKYAAGLSLANGLFNRELYGERDFNGINGIEDFEKPTYTGDNYSERARIAIIIGDCEVQGINDARAWADSLRKDGKTTVFCIYVNPSENYISYARQMADEVIHVAEYDDTLIDALVNLTDHIGGSEIELGSTTVVQDVVTSDFKVPAGASSVVVKTAPYTDVTGAYADNSFGDAVESSLEPTITTDAATGETTITVTGFDFGANWCGLDDETPRGNKLILEVKIEPDGDLIGGKMATNTPESGLLYTIDGEEQFLPFPIPTINDIPLKLKIRKEGMVGDENAVIVVKAKTPSGVMLDVMPPKPMRFVLNKQMPEVTLTNLDDSFYYEISEESWAWDYERDSHTLSTETQHKNPFVLTNVKPENASTVKHDEDLMHTVVTLDLE